MAVERIRTLVVPDHDELARVVARRIADLVREKAAAGGSAVLGLATGSTPIGVYRELIRMHREEGLSFAGRGHLQPRRVLPDGPGEHPLLPSVHVGELLLLSRHPARAACTSRAATFPARRGRGECRRYEAAIARRGRDRPPAARHRTHRPHRLQRARLRRRQPDPAHHARPGDPKGRRRRLLRRGERAPRGRDDGRGDDPRGAGDPAPRHRRAQGRDHPPHGGRARSTTRSPRPFCSAIPIPRSTSTARPRRPLPGSRPPGGSGRWPGPPTSRCGRSAGSRARPARRSSS